MEKLTSWEVIWLILLPPVIGVQFGRWDKEPDQLFACILSFILIAFLPRIWKSF